MIFTLAEPVLNWYYQNARNLPWRNPPDTRNLPDPYAVWVSEIMLQQTQVDTVIPYYLRWMERFPTITALAQASQQEVLALWEGLGYYRRARNLHRAAHVVVKDYGGKLPSDANALRQLPGIGPYTAGAIASIAFGLDETALDGNIRRVLARFYNLSLPLDSPEGRHQLLHFAELNIPTGRAGEFNQAMMDLGAKVCTPRQPECSSCPLVTECQAFAFGVVNERPVRITRRSIPHVTATAAVIRRVDRVLITRRPQNGLLGGLWGFPGGELQADENLALGLQRNIWDALAVEIQVKDLMNTYHHAYTHFRVTLHAFCCNLINDGEPKALSVDELHWVPIDKLLDYPMGKIDRQISKRLMIEEVV